MDSIQSIAECPPFPEIEGCEFRHVPEYLGYAADSTGGIWSCFMPRGQMSGKRAWRPLAMCKKDGYMHVRVVDIKTRRHPSVKVHRLVCSAFHGPCPRGLECCHGDGRRDNNVPSNLRWDTRRNNLLDSVRLGMYGHSGGKRNKLTRDNVFTIRRIGRSLPLKQVASMFKVSPSHVSEILNNRTRLKESACPTK